MNSPEKMAEVRERFSLPEPEAEHECRATKFPDDGSERSTRLSGPSPCYVGQWTFHGPHDYPTRVQAWLGGGEILRHCPGKTSETVLG
jgi:hypothetical protein